MAGTEEECARYGLGSANGGRLYCHWVDWGRLHSEATLGCACVWYVFKRVAPSFVCFEFSLGREQKSPTAAVSSVCVCVCDMEVWACVITVLNVDVLSVDVLDIDGLV